MDLLGNTALLVRDLGDIIFTSQVACLGSSSFTTDQSRLAVKVLGNLLEWRVLGLNEELPHNDQLEGDPATVYNVVLPADGTECDRVYVLVEPQRHVDA